MESSNGNAATHEVYREVNKRIREVGNTFESGANATSPQACAAKPQYDGVRLPGSLFSGLSACAAS